MKEKLRTIFLGKRLRDSDLGEEKFNVLWGIPVFASDAISSVSYAGEEILLVLLPVLGMASYGKFLPIVAAIIGLLGLLVFCYRQTIDEYPSGGGAYIVASSNLGEKTGLVAGTSLVFGYILTVAVSSCAGAAAITSAFPALLPWKAVLAFAIICILTWGNLRGIRESAVMFGVPTYLFIFTMLALIITGIIRYALGLYTPAQQELVAANTVEIAGDSMLFLILKAFASGCTALTGVEAVSNGVPNFKDPSQKNAKRVLYCMAGLVCVIFLGCSVMISLYQIVPGENATAVSQLAAAIFGAGSIMYYVVQIMTVVILALAANTAYADLPLLMSLMARDGYLPRALTRRGTRLSFSNGILFLFVVASVLVFVFGGDQHLLLPLYASGVFISFLLAQVGMLVHWVKNKGDGWKFKAAVNGVGTCVTGVVLIIIVIMKFTSGAWVTLLLIAAMVSIMLLIHRHYARVSEQLNVPQDVTALPATGGKVILPVQSVNRSFLKTLQCARAFGLTDVELFHVASDEAAALELKQQLEALELPGSFAYETTPYRNANEVLLAHIEGEAAALPEGELLTVLMGTLVTANPLEKLLHNDITDRLAQKLEGCENICVFKVPYQLH